MSESPFNSLLQHVADDVASIPESAVQLVGAVIAMQNDLPQALSAFIMARLALRADMSVVSPAAEAVMRMRAFAEFSEMEFAKFEIQTQHALLKAIALDDKVLVAAAFMTKLANRLAEVMQLTDAKLAYCHHSKIAAGVAFEDPIHSTFGE
jgi:hypothetical protein